MSNGITSILNSHYNSNIKNFDIDIESENLKTVMLKIGEVPDIIKSEDSEDEKNQKIADYYKDLPRIKKLKLDPEVYKKNKFTTKDKRNLVEKCTIDFEQYYNLISDKNKELWQDADQWTKYKLLPANIKGEILEGLRKFDYSQIEGMPEDFENNIKRLGDLDDYFESYGKCRRFILRFIYEHILCKNEDERFAYNTSTQDFVDKIPLGFRDEEKIGLQRLKDWLWDNKKSSSLGQNDLLVNPQSKDKNEDHKNEQLITNTFHQIVRKVCKENKAILDFITKEKMDRLLPNLYEDCGASLLGFYKRLAKAEVEFKWTFDSDNSKNIYFLIGEFKNIFKNIDNSSLSDADIIKKQNFNNTLKEIEKIKVVKNDNSKDPNKQKEHTKTATPIFNHFINYNLYRRQFIEGWEEISKLKVCELGGGFVFTQEQRDQVKEVLKDYLPIQFDPITTYPNIDESKNKWSTIDKEITDIQNEIKNIDPKYITITQKDKEGKIIDGISIKSANNLFQGSFDKRIDEIPESDWYIDFFGKKVWKKPSGQAKEIIWNKFKAGNKFLMWEKANEEISKLANKNIQQFESNILKQIQDKDETKYICLREYAGWIYVKLTLKTVSIAHPLIRENLIKKISQLASTISGFAYNLERSGFENQSIYLSDFLTPPTTEGSDFKSSAYLATTKNGNSLSLALSFGKSILRDDQSNNKALVYTFDEQNDKIANKFNLENSQKIANQNDKTIAKIIVLPKWDNQKDKLNKENLEYFDYEYWNIKEPLAYKSFTKPNINIGIGEPEFNFPLHFGVNQSRKYFWNNVRGTQNEKGEKPKDKDGNEIENNQIHNIFNPNSRLKVSSMRLIRKHNPIRNVWEYYLSLAIYRLEEANEKCLPKEIKNEIIGVDIGENTLLAMGTIDYSGQNITSNFPVLQHIHNYKTSASNLIYQSKEDLRIHNYLKPETRLMLKNKTNSIRNQAAGFATKTVLSGTIVVVEGEYLASTKNKYENEDKIHNQIVKRLAVDFPKKTVDKLKCEIPCSKIFGGKKLPILDSKIDGKNIKGIEIANNHSNVDDLFSNTITQLTSQICSNCGCVAGKFRDVEKFKKDLFSSKQQFELKSYIKLNNYDDQLKLNLVTWSRKNEFEYLYNWSIKLDKLPKDTTTKEFRDIESQNKYKTELLKLITEPNDKKLKEKLEPTKSVLSPLCWRPKWYYGNIDKFRCFLCDFVCECDDQAGINIARFKLFNNLFYNDLGNFDRSKFNNEYLKIKSNFEKLSDENKKEIGKIKVEQKDEEFLRTFWYQTQLATHGYDEHGNSKWNIIPAQKPLN
jgi:hypothetical protein